jgi:hypothetical protein
MKTRCAAGPALALALAAALSLQGAAAAPPAAELARCAAISDTSERLACYDSLECATKSAAAERLACYDALAKTRAAQPQSAPAAAAHPEPAGDDPASFGLTRHEANPAPRQQKIKARVASVTEDRHGNVTVALDNGQTWAVHELDPRLRSGDEVTIRRAALGSYLMTTAARHSYRVQRLQ